MNFILLTRALSVSGLCFVLERHVDMAWWEGGLMSFCAMWLLGTLYDDKKPKCPFTHRRADGS